MEKKCGLKKNGYYKMNNLLLDLDETLISSYETPSTSKPADYVFHDGVVTWYIYKRPHLDEFLDYVFANFNVCIWTASEQDYCLGIVKNVIIGNHTERVLDYILFRYHCDVSESLYKNNNKSLRVLWDDFKIKGMSIDNCILVDDRVDLKTVQPDCNVINVPRFYMNSYNAAKDTVLLDLIEQLKLLF